MQLDQVLVRALIGSGPGYDPYECRDCGTSLKNDRGECPACGSGAITDIQV